MKIEPGNLLGWNLKRVVVVFVVVTELVLKIHHIIATGEVQV
jgi:hypothetical protein